MENDQRTKAHQALLNLFSSATGFPIGLFETKEGQTVGLFSAGSLERFEEHCRLIQSFPGGKEACDHDQCHRAKTAFVDGEYKLTCCHAGIWNQASPVRINGDVQAVFLYGETLIDDIDNMQITLEHHQQAVKTLNLSLEDSKQLHNALNKVKKKSLEKLEESRGLLAEIEAVLFGFVDEEQRQLRNLEKAVHELQTRLQAIISLAENMVTGSYSLKSSNLRQESGRMLNKAEALATIVNNLGEFQQEYQFKLTKVRPIISRAWSIYEDEAKDRHIKLKINLEKVNDTEPELDLSPRHMEWAINNLIHNAIKYSFTGSADRIRFVEILGRKERDYYIISVSNYGIGIKKDEIEKGLIFKDGYQGELTRGENRTGSGKGLTFVKRVIDRHKGTIEVDSKPAGEKNESQNGQPHLNVITISLPLKQG